MAIKNSMFQYNEAKNQIAKYIIWGGISLIFLMPFAFIFFMSSALDFGSPDSFPSDVELIKIFQGNEADFERLNQMAREDSDFVRITEESEAHPRSESGKNLSEERWSEYRNLFRKLDLKKGILNHQPKEIWFLSATAGMVTGGSEKGYMYLTEEPFPIVDSLDNPNFNIPELKDRKEKILYRKLKDNWYLYYLVD